MDEQQDFDIEFSGSHCSNSCSIAVRKRTEALYEPESQIFPLDNDVLCLIFANFLDSNSLLAVSCVCNQVQLILVVYWNSGTKLLQRTAFGLKGSQRRDGLYLI